MIRFGPNEIENETDMKVADSLTTWRSQRARGAICRKSAQTFHLPLVKYEDEYIDIGLLVFNIFLYNGNLWIFHFVYVLISFILRQVILIEYLLNGFDKMVN